MFTIKITQFIVKTFKRWILKLSARLLILKRLPLGAAFVIGRDCVGNTEEADGGS